MPKVQAIRQSSTNLLFARLISKDNMLIDYKGNVGRWHGYVVKCSRKDIDALQGYIKIVFHFYNKVYNSRSFLNLYGSENHGSKILGRIK